MRTSLFHAILLCALVASLHGGETDKDVKAPLQPASGPGSSAYPHRDVKRTSFGEGSAQYWIFEPADPAPAGAPVVLFMHGWGAMEPFPYIQWIRHLARRGNIVIYPRYQAALTTPPVEFTDNAASAIKEALSGLAARGKIKPDLEKVAAVGHSFGGIVAANLAARAAELKLPKIKALSCVEPGSGFFKVYADYSKIPGDTLLQCIAADLDFITGSLAARKIYRESSAIDAANKDFILCQTEKRGEVTLSADHFAPLAADALSTNALDWHGFWKWFDALSDAAFTNTNRKYALGNTPEQRHMGKWSDGVNVREASVTDDP